MSPLGPHLGQRRAERHHIVADSGQAAGNGADRGLRAEARPGGPVAGAVSGQRRTVLRGSWVVAAALWVGEWGE